MASGPETWGEAFRKFLVFNEGWYRPLSYHITDRLIFEIFDIRNVYLIKTVSVIFILANSLTATLLARRVFGSGLVECALTFSLILSHPLNYVTAVWGIGYADALFTIFLNLFVIGYLALLEASKAKLCETTQLSAIAAALVGVACCLLLIATVTSHERGLAVFPIAGILYAYYHWPLNKIGRRSIPATAILIFCSIAAILYLAVVWTSKGHMSGPNYRTQIDFVYILPNLLKAIELPLRMLFVGTGFWYDAHLNVGFNLFALPFALCFVGYIGHVLRHDGVRERRQLFIVATLFVCCLPIPVIFGAAWWQFYTAAIYLSIAMGRAIWFWVEQAGARFGAALLAAVFVWMSVATIKGVSEEYRPGTDHFESVSIVPLALNDSTLRLVPYVPQVVYYDTGKFGNDLWRIGQGNLFKYLYQDSSIIEVAMNRGRVIYSDACLVAIGKTALAFRLEDDLSWSPVNARPCER